MKTILNTKDKEGNTYSLEDAFHYPEGCCVHLYRYNKDGYVEDGWIFRVDQIEDKFCELGITLKGVSSFRKSIAKGRVWMCNWENPNIITVL